jgi:hypothetical protein
MTHHTLMPALAALVLLVSGTVAIAQEVEPGVQTSSSAAPVKPTPPPAKAADKAKTPSPPPTTAAQPSPKATTGPTSGSGSSKSSDRIELGSTQISGNRELPKVMYVVPWRRADPGDFSGRPPNSLLDEALTPVDRDVFRRQNSYYGAVRDQTQAAAPQSAAPGTSGSAATPKDEK